MFCCGVVHFGAAADFTPTNTSESLSAVAVSDCDHQGQEVDLTQPADGSLQQPTAAGAAARRPAR